MTAAEKALVEALKSAQKEIDGLEAKIAEQSALEITVNTFLHDIDNHNDENGPILMNGAMWLQVNAMRKLVSKKD